MFNLEIVHVSLAFDLHVISICYNGTDIVKVGTGFIELLLIIIFCIITK